MCVCVCALYLGRDEEMQFNLNIAITDTLYVISNINTIIASKLAIFGMRTCVYVCICTATQTIHIHRHRKYPLTRRTFRNAAVHTENRRNSLSICAEPLKYLLSLSESCDIWKAARFHDFYDCFLASLNIYARAYIHTKRTRKINSKR